jgi:hypothetical protein
VFFGAFAFVFFLGLALEFAGRVDEGECAGEGESAEADLAGTGEGGLGVVAGGRAGGAESVHEAVESVEFGLDEGVVEGGGEAFGDLVGAFGGGGDVGRGLRGALAGGEESHGCLLEDGCGREGGWSVPDIWSLSSF